MHAITANKGPVVHAYRELTELAQAKGRKFYFESTVMDGAPIFSLFRSALPAAQLNSFRGILNSTTNLILGRMEDGETFEDAVKYCQEIGLAETDPSGDVDGWDAAIKVAALVTVLMGVPLKPQEVDRTGIRGITAEMVAEAKERRANAGSWSARLKEMEILSRAAWPRNWSPRLRRCTAWKVPRPSWSSTPTRYPVSASSRAIPARRPRPMVCWRILSMQ